MVFISDYHSYVRQAAAFNETAEGRALLGMRWRVEPTIAWLVRYQGCRQTRRVGQAAAQCQLFQAGAVRNLLLWLKRVAQRQARQAA
jgi:Transposase DDE domain